MEIKIKTTTKSTIEERKFEILFKKDNVPNNEIFPKGAFVLFCIFFFIVEKIMPVERDDIYIYEAKSTPINVKVSEIRFAFCCLTEVTVPQHLFPFSFILTRWHFTLFLFSNRVFTSSQFQLFHPLLTLLLFLPSFLCTKRSHPFCLYRNFFILFLSSHLFFVFLLNVIFSPPTSSTK